MEVEAFNAGMRHAVDRAVFARGAAKHESPSFVSSVRRRINGWMPLYINEMHWAEARRYVPSAVAQLADRCDSSSSPRDSTVLRPEDALDVCCSLLTCAVVGFTVGQSECASPRSAARGTASERAVQMYADVHRLLLQLAKEHPDIRCLARARLLQFISYPAARTQDLTPSLGSLVHCLLIVEEVAWEDLAPCLLPEALRRHAVRQRCRGWHFDPCQCGESVKELIAAWDGFALQVGVVTCFSVLFCQRVGRPPSCTLRDVEATYDRRWGRLRPDLVADVLSTCAHISEHQSLSGVLQSLLPSRFSADNLDRVAELILWAERYGRRRDVGVIQPEAWPLLGDIDCPLLRQWETQQRKCEELTTARRTGSQLRRRRARQHRRMAEQWWPCVQWNSDAWWYTATAY